MTSGHTNRTRTLAALTALALAGGGASLLGGTASAAPGGELVYGLTENNRLVSFRSQTPGTIIDNRQLQNALGVPLTTDLLGIDVRPRTGELYGVGDNDQLYVIDPATGVVTERGAVITPSLTGTSFGFDFNPAADRIRIISDANQNLRVNPDTGGASSVTAPGTNTDGPLRYSDTDRNAGLDPQAVAAAYTNSVDGTTTTAQFAIDAGPNTFVQQNSNPGILTTIGSLGTAFGDVTDAGLDISPATDTTYALLETTAGTPAAVTRTFATVNRTTGAATAVGQVGPAATATVPALTVEDVAVAPARFLVTPGSVAEGGTATVTVRREGDVADAQTVTYAVTNGTTGSAVEDAVAASGTLTFGVGERSRTFAVTTLDDDFTEGTEALTVALSGATAGAVASNGVLTITDDEAGLATGLTADSRLVDFNVNTPGTATNVRPLVGLGDVRLVGIDTRPRTGELFGVGNDSHIYLINRTTGVVTDRGELGVPLSGTTFGVDFNPVADRLRIVSDANQNLRVNVDAPANVTGGTTGTTQDMTLRYVEGDANVGTDPAVVAAAYTNSFNNGAQNNATPTATTQYDVDAATRALVRQDSNPGTLNTIGGAEGLGLAAGVTVVPTGAGLDIAAAGNAAFASFGTSAAAARQLYRVNLTTGRATSLGNLATPASGLTTTTTIEDFALTATERATFTPPTASPSASASATATATASATPTMTMSGSPTPTATATAPANPICTNQLSVSLNREFIIPTIAVTVTVTGAAPGALVDLQAYSRPSDDYNSVRTRAADSSGSVSFDVVPGTNTRLFAQCVSAVGGAGQAGSSSLSKVINVRTALSLTVVRNGTRNYTFQGRILPRRTGQLVTLYRVERDGTRVITSQLKTDNSGTYRLTRQFTGSGTFGFITRTGQTLTNAAGESTSAQRQRSAEYLRTGRGDVRPTAIF